jgi:hypothetical protein
MGEARRIWAPGDLKDVIYEQRPKWQPDGSHLLCWPLVSKNTATALPPVRCLGNILCVPIRISYKISFKPRKLLTKTLIYRFITPSCLNFLLFNNHSIHAEGGRLLKAICCNPFSVYIHSCAFFMKYNRQMQQIMI